MKLSTLMAIKGVIVLVFGIGFVLVPVTVLSWYNVELGAGGAYMTRLFGAAFILLGLVLWPARKDTGSVALKALVMAVFIGDIIGFVVALIGQLSGLVNALGWLTVALYFFLAIGFGYHALKKPKTA